jgi:hypothetical protein
VGAVFSEFLGYALSDPCCTAGDYDYFILEHKKPPGLGMLFISSIKTETARLRQEKKRKKFKMAFTAGIVGVHIAKTSHSCYNIRKGM